eukprot:scaffold68_cov340-Pavlova_lutheri.AAC.2
MAKTTRWTAALACLSLVLRVLLAWKGAPKWLQDRTDVSPPQGTMRRIKEGAALWRMGLSPYLGSAWQGPPLLMVLLKPFLYLQNKFQWAYVIPYLVADVIAGNAIRMLAKHLGTKSERNERQGEEDMTRTVSSGWALYDLKNGRGEDKKGETIAYPSKDWAMVLWYLWNPCTLATCLAGSVAAIENACVLGALVAAVQSNVPLASFFIVAGTYLSLHPIIYALPVGVILVRGTENLLNVNKDDHNRKKDTKAAWRFVAWFVAWSVLLIGLSEGILFSGNHEQSAHWMSQVYGFILGVGDLSPNMGLYWYLLVEMFDDFRGLFTFALQMGSLALLPVLFLRLSDRPVFLACVQAVIISLFRPYPTFADQALYCTLIPLFSDQLLRMKHKAALVNAFLWIDALGPVFWYLWTCLGVANANFYYAVSLVYACVQILLLNDMIGAAIEYQREIKKEKKDI